MTTPYLLYAKLGAGLVLIVAIFGAGFHFGGMSSKSALEAYRAAQSELTAKAVLAERASAEATAARNHTIETTHAQTIVQIDAAPAIRTPVFLCNPLRPGPVPSSATQTDSQPAHPEAGGSQPVDRADIRPAIEELKKRLEKIMADYRQEDAEWPR